MAFDLSFVVDYFSQDQAGGTRALDIRRPGITTMVGPRRVRGPMTKIPGVTGNHHPVPGDDEVYEDQGSMRVGDEEIFAIGPQLRAADEATGAQGDQHWVQLAEIGTITVTDDADDTYRVAILGITYPFVASSNTITEIRDGLLTAIGSPAGVSVVASGVDAILVAGSTAGQALDVTPTPETLTYVQTRFRDDVYEIWKRGIWSYGKYTKYNARLMRTERGV